MGLLEGVRLSWEADRMRFPLGIRNLPWLERGVCKNLVIEKK